MCRKKGSSFSPVLAYSEIFDEFDHECGADTRAAVLEMCKEDLKRADVFIWVECQYSYVSEGMLAERILADSLGMRIEIVEVY